MRKRIYEGNYTETDRKARVKLYKTNKGWVSSLISSIGLMKLVGAKSESLNVQTTNTKIESILKGAAALGAIAGGTALTTTNAQADRSEERRVGKECRSRWSPYH